MMALYLVSRLKHLPVGRFARFLICSSSLPLFLPNHLQRSQPVSLSVCLTVCLSVCLTVYLSVRSLFYASSHQLFCLLFSRCPFQPGFRFVFPPTHPKASPPPFLHLVRSRSLPLLLHMPIGSHVFFCPCVTLEISRCKIVS